MTADALNNMLKNIPFRPFIIIMIDDNPIIRVADPNIMIILPDGSGAMTLLGGNLFTIFSLELVKTFTFIDSETDISTWPRPWGKNGKK